jgi:glycosyltransferase involved in cell wall biosynthesis
MAASACNGRHSLAFPSIWPAVRVAYLCNRFPSISTAFILREVEQLRRLGVEVHTFSIRRPDPGELLSAADRTAAETTHTVLALPWRELVSAHVRAFTDRPVRYLRTLVLALRLAAPGLRGRVWQLFYFAEAMAVWHRCRQLDLRHLHAHFANQATDVALLVTSFGGEGWSWSLTLHGPAEFADVSRHRLAQKVERARTVVCISHFARSQVMALVDERHWSKLRVVHCGVDTDRFADPGERPNHRPELRLLHVGRLVGVKGQVVLLEALALLRERGMTVQATIVGEGDRRAALLRRRDELGLGAGVRFVGAVGQDDLPELYAGADVFCLSSFSEGVPVVLMEAMASALPVVATRVMGVPELVRDGVSGFVVAPSVATELADALGALAADPSLRRRMGLAGRGAVVEGFDLRATGPQLRAALLDAMGAA